MGTMPLVMYSVTALVIFLCRSELAAYDVMLAKSLCEGEASVEGRALFLDVPLGAMLRY